MLIRVRFWKLSDVITGQAIREPSPNHCNGCRWRLPVMRCALGAWHHALASRVRGEVMQCDAEAVTPSRPKLRLVP